MAKRGSWYFEGYQSETKLDAAGREKQVLVYRGEWYGLGLTAERCRRYKLLCALLSVVMTGSLLLINFFPGAGGMTPWVGGPCLLALVPLIFFWIGLVNFLVSKPEWELRVLYGGYRRVERWGLAFLVLMGLTLAAELVFVIRGGSPLRGELFYLLGAVLCAACAGAILWLCRRHPASVVRGPDIR